MVLALVSILGASRAASAAGVSSRSRVSAHVASFYDNASIATTALKYVGQWGGEACADAKRSGETASTSVYPTYPSGMSAADPPAPGRTIKPANGGDGQCRSFVNCILWMASGHTQWVGFDPADYFHAFLAPQGGGTAGVEITNVSNLIKGDIVQIGNGTHTFIIVKASPAAKDTATTKTFDIVDSNNNYDEIVHEHTRTVTLAPTERAFRMGTPRVAGRGTGAPASARLYFAQADNTIRAIPLTGRGSPATIARFPAHEFPAEMAVSSNAVYWTNVPDQTTIWRASLAGAGVRKFVGGLKSAGSVAVADGSLYWVDSNGIGRAALDGSKIQRSLIRIPRQPGINTVAEGLASDGHYLYFTRCWDDTIGRVGLDGSGLSTRFILIPRPKDCPQGLAVVGDHLYWTELNGIGGSLGRASLDGKTVEPGWLDVNVELGPFDVTGSSKYLFWSHAVAAKGPTYVGRSDIDGSQLTSAFIERPGDGPSTIGGPLAVGP
jgi:hypothetical protein